MKTAMDELIESIDSKLKVFSNFNQEDRYTQGVVIHLTGIKRIAKQLLEKEQQQILSAYDAGKEQPSNSQQCPVDYYDQNFK